MGEAIRKKAGSQEACSTCDERVAKYRPEVRKRVLKRLSGPVQETL